MQQSIIDAINGSAADSSGLATEIRQIQQTAVLNTLATEATLGTIDTDTGVIAGDTTSLDTKEGTTGEAVNVAGTRAAQLRYIGEAVSDVATDTSIVALTSTVHQFHALTSTVAQEGTLSEMLDTVNSLITQDSLSVNKPLATETTLAAMQTTVNSFATPGSSSVNQPLATEDTLSRVAKNIVKVRDQLVEDGVTNALKVIDYAHHAVHNGSHFFATHTVGAVASGGQVDVIINVPDNGLQDSALGVRAHMIIKVSTTGATRFRILEDGTLLSSSSPASVITAFNSDRSSENESILTILDTGSSEGGTLIWDERFGNVAGGGRCTHSTGGGSRGDSEIILGTPGAILGNYHLIVENTDTGDNPMEVSIVLEWYEHQDITE